MQSHTKVSTPPLMPGLSTAAINSFAYGPITALPAVIDVSVFSGFFLASTRRALVAPIPIASLALFCEATTKESNPGFNLKAN